MQMNHTNLNELKLVGITVRTNNTDEAKVETGKIFPIVQQYFHQQMADKIHHRTKPGVTICAYTEYESDHTGDYTYFIGEQVESFDTIPDGFTTLSVPAQRYAKFTNGPGAMPEVLREPWEKIWTMNESDFGGKRRYHTDFEVYDERAADHENIVLDIMIGLED